MVVVRFRRVCAVFVVFGALCVPALADAQDPPRIVANVSAGGIDLSGLTLAQATTRLDQSLTPRLTRDVVVRAAGRRFVLDGTTLKVRFSAAATAKRALAVAAPTAGPDSGGAAYGTIVDLTISHAKIPVRAFAAQVAAGVYRAGADATLTIGVRKMHVHRAKLGVALDAKALAATIDAAADDPGGPRLFTQRVTRTRPAINANDLRRINGTVITIDKSTFTLRLFKQLKLSKTYQVAVGQPAYPTPVGLFRIQDKQVNPIWSVPNSPWAGELGGTTVEGGTAANPLKARWMGITDGVGIHGTGEPWSVGTAASHGCLRMRVPDVIDLFPRVPVGTPVLIR
jgi:lipoprotein-anchoring transpeptidase ErfK/SrfK